VEGFPPALSAGVPPDKNLRGLSFAVADVAGFLAALFDRDGGTDAAGILTRAAAAGWTGKPPWAFAPSATRQP